MIKTGIIYSVDLKNRIFSLNMGRRLDFYYISNNLMKKFKKYLYKGNYVSFTVLNEEKTKRGMVMAYTVSYFKEISVPGRYGKDIFYSKRDIKSELKNFLNGLDTLLFIDIEMSMPPYVKDELFVSELIQIGMYLVDKNDNLILNKGLYVKTEVCRYLSDRTRDFLNIDYDFLLKNGISYKDFYDYFSEIINKYNPTIVVFGKNDKSFLESSYKLNNLSSLSLKSRFVNINQLIKTYYDLSNDPGLFNIYERLYNKKPSLQSHNAKEDAYYTYLVYKKFKDDVNK